MNSFRKEFDRYNWDQVKAGIYAKTGSDVERALGKERRELEDFKALISPAAAPYLEEMAHLSHQLDPEAVWEDHTDVLADVSFK